MEKRGNNQRDTYSKYADIDNTLKNIGKKIQEGNVLGYNKVSAMAGQFLNKTQNAEPKMQKSVLNQIVEEQPVAQATGQLSHQVCPLVDPAIYDKSWQGEEITDCLFYLATPVFSKVDKIEPLAPGTVVYADTLVKEITRRTGDRGTVHAVDRARPSYILGRQRICVLDVPSWKFSIECVGFSPPKKSGITSILRSAQEVM
ncbi:hypothetical protein EAI_02988 [Harpegnathos saltator]|uniref:Uncharacterized protein n=1 Tax=Harpegnathos saltator TaxID=610380 RepID=E2BF47_HARSA|nr:hypothetical protein EAI_02988 [Harpegnathos saltator]